MGPCLRQWLEPAGQIPALGLKLPRQYVCMVLPLPMGPLSLLCKATHYCPAIHFNNPEIYISANPAMAGSVYYMYIYSIVLPM